MTEPIYICEQHMLQDTGGRLFPSDLNLRHDRMHACSRIPSDLRQHAVAAFCHYEYKVDCWVWRHLTEINACSNALHHVYSGALASFASSIPEIHKIISNLQKFTKPYLPARGTQHIIVSGNITIETMRSLVNDLSRPDRRQRKLDRKYEGPRGRSIPPFSPLGISQSTIG
ncbi:uncharacterized protein LOC129587159 isoform X2 [Paramacrobiotus metropolitanus]|uniref:uncharacterized protein LOC129587159 isoform X2 n=1 Tax=Paramacrobiotus metropolitanus TaxID=2943436 RepID=UPI00244600C2|nr:uncharacterized protein LOC129587159 isoform X2 [Paramacrobiotus metropolitanus]